MAVRLGNFELLAPLASGGMAEIFLARQRSSAFSRLVVVKRIHAHLSKVPEFVSMFLQEARLAARINHPNVVQIHDVGEWQGDFFIAMEHIDGVSVGAICQRAVARGVKVHHTVAAELAAQACAGLHAAHELRDEEGERLDLVHRDVSPHNLMVTRSGVVKLLDFGIAKARDTESMTRTGHIRGKVPYMSPEQCQGDRSLDRRTDVFSLGVVLYELATTRRLFKRATELMVLKAITEDPVPPPRSHNPELPAALEEVILRALKREPAERYQTAAEMERAIRGVLSELGQATSASTLAEHLSREHAAQLGEQARLVQEVITSDTKIDEELLLSPTRTVTLAGQQTPHTAEAPRRWRRWATWSGLGATLVVVIGLGLWLWSEARPGGPPLRYGLVPIYPTKTVERDLRPFERYLEGRLGRRVEIKVAEDYRSLGEAVGRGRVDFAAVPPLEYVITRARFPGIQVVASQTYERARTYQGLLVVKADSSIHRLDDLEGKTICYVDPHSTSGYLMPRHYLREKGHDPDRFLGRRIFSGRHTAVMREVLSDRCQVGAIYSVALLNARDFDIPSTALRTLAVTGQAPFGVVCAAPTVPRAQIDALGRALLDLDPRRHLGSSTVGQVYRISGYAAPRLEMFRRIEAAARREGLLGR